DHNQEMWEAWTLLDEDRLPEGKARVHSAGLRAYGYLILHLRGRDFVKRESADAFDLVPDRSLDRPFPGFSSAAGQRRDAIDWDTCWLESMGGSEKRRIYLATPESDQVRSLELPWIAQLVIV
ncbi:MAG: hypothetical protein GWO24_16215, partial [Akkermansiaceae bacterium]|nr:hypothetical protein [Akkermansiaceae bacterium]